ncbi:hypothetical protein TCT1_04680 [Xenorhabdus sp. TCT-1]|uniref:Transposase putative helix-turn-helix domain-containing protein n=1 Tax=Xenorhabdus taiwanensis TaxID=3085177 RepID=A0ABN7C1T2_9GAMM|nr:hypothetical protein TCT1_04680 [Xenorhabdus sp. TCT-1]
MPSAVRFAYNKALHIKKHIYKQHGVSLTPRKDLNPLLATAKKSRKYAWLKAYDSIALQQAVINLNTAFDNFFNPKRRARFPAFKRKHGKQSSYHCVGVKVLNNANGKTPGQAGPVVCEFENLSPLWSQRSLAR